MKKIIIMSLAVLLLFSCSGKSSQESSDPIIEDSISQEITELEETIQIQIKETEEELTQIENELDDLLND